MCCRCVDNEWTEFERQNMEVDRADRTVFVQELLLSSLAEGLRLEEHCDSFELSSHQNASSEPVQLVTLEPDMTKLKPTNETPAPKSPDPVNIEVAPVEKSSNPVNESPVTTNSGVRSKQHSLPYCQPRGPRDQALREPLPRDQPHGTSPLEPATHDQRVLSQRGPAGNRMKRLDYAGKQSSERDAAAYVNH